MTTLPATVQLSTLAHEITDLTERLAPASVDVVVKHLYSMQRAGMVMPNGIQSDTQEQVYSYALAQVPAFGLKRATEKLIRGEYENIRAGFIPTPPELAAMARAESRVVRDDLARAREKEASIRASLEDQARSQAAHTPEARARVRALRESFQLQNAQFNASHGNVAAVNEPLDYAQAEYWRAIDAMKDQPVLSAEQQAFRRQIGFRLTSQEHREAAE